MPGSSGFSLWPPIGLRRSPVSHPGLLLRSSLQQWPPVDLVLILILLVGLWLRWGLNGTWRLGPDEALYASWARQIASQADVWLAHVPDVDKSPLFIYAMAGAMRIYGYTEFATRFPSIIASTALIPLVYLLAYRLYRKASVAQLAALLMALSPFAILYAPTAYLDPLMVMWLLLAAVLACYGRWGWAGVAMALAILTKQEAPLFAPLVIILGIGAALSTDESAHEDCASPCGGTDGTESRSRIPYHFLRPVAIFPAVTLLLAWAGEWLWESHRPGQPSPFSLGLSNYGGIGLAPLDQLGPRLAAWWQEALRYVFASPLLDLLFMAGGITVLTLAGDPARPADRLLALSIAWVLVARTLISFQVWNRYMLILAPLLCLFLARVVHWGWTRVPGLRPPAPNPGGDASLSSPQNWGAGGPAQDWGAGGRARLVNLVPLAFVAALMLSPVSNALAGRIPVGSDHGQYSGIEQTAQFIRENVPPGSVIYHQELGWQYGYYLYGVHLDFWWYPSLDWLAQTAASRAEQSQYIVFPSWEDGQEMASVLAAHHMQLLPVHVARRPDGSISFRTYRIAPIEPPG